MRTYSYGHVNNTSRTAITLDRSIPKAHEIIRAIAYSSTCNHYIGIREHSTEVYI